MPPLTWAWAWRDCEAEGCGAALEDCDAALTLLLVVALLAQVHENRGLSGLFRLAHIERTSRTTTHHQRPGLRQPRCAAWQQRNSPKDSSNR